MNSHRVRGLCCIFLLTFLLSPTSHARWLSLPEQDSARGFHWFPDQPLFPRLVADGTGQQMSLSKDLESKRIVGSIGGLQRLFETTLANCPLQFSVGATVYGNFIRQPDVLDVVTMDFFVDLPVDIRLSNDVTIRTGWGHYSAHLADDGIEALGRHSINYAKDYIPLFIAYTVSGIRGFVYGGARIDYYTIPERNGHVVVEGGSEFADLAIGSGMSVYGAIDIKIRQEISWGSTQSYQAGIRMITMGSHVLRIAYTFRTGADERGQFYNQPLTSSLIGVFLDF